MHDGVVLDYREDENMIDEEFIFMECGLLASAIRVVCDYDCYVVSSKKT